ncbi:MAG: hypothetical protein MZU79_06445 [Anaerotruncus sp.]|nr:hypothetical protein [Anaerotruncus sp.]
MSFVAEEGAPALLKGTPLETVCHPRRRQASLGGDGRGPPRHPRRGRGRPGIEVRRPVRHQPDEHPVRPRPRPGLRPARRRSARQGRGPGRAGPAGRFRRTSLMTPHVIRLENRLGEEIVGLLNTALPLDDRPVPVVIIPPAFGKTKEVLFGLALTLVRELPPPRQAAGRRPLRRHPQEGRKPQRSRSRRAALRDAQHELQPGGRRTS